MTSGVSTMLSLGKVPAPGVMIDALQEVVVETALDVAGAFSLTFGLAPTEGGDWSTLLIDPFKPMMPIGIRIGTGGMPLPLAVLNGFATAQRARFAEGGKSVLEIRGIDITAVMNLEEKAKAWTGLPDGAIAAALFGQYAVVPKVTMTAPRIVEPMGSTVQRGSDIRFLRRLARRNGFDCYVQPEPITGLDTGYFGPPTTTGVASAVINVNMGSLTNVRDLEVRYDMARPTLAMALGLDTATKAPGVGVAPVSKLVPMGIEPATLRAVAGAGVAGAMPMVRLADTGGATVAELQPSAQATVDRAGFALTVEGTTDESVGVLRPGALIAVRGVGRLFNGLYQTTRCRISLVDGRFEQRFAARRNAVTMTGTEFVAV
ncbi:phage late control D family protein [Mycolicibacterium bacteremicum]|uniref:Phage tail protein n=1 Tax=Mycolicibacterium bacteremicum TaxID=564198 RepID=A0A1W9Z527_MYCBA|nr:hypothetical protein [Mycolicibacterium bacteremicum]MCV7433711.1 hypothetical protein [Mycolicibacterium bacteremicum]ORA07249.1 hypothetical protein BST17_01945 [Mycolicibacterium bacteremicum]